MNSWKFALLLAVVIQAILISAAFLTVYYPVELTIVLGLAVTTASLTLLIKRVMEI